MFHLILFLFWELALNPISLHLLVHWILQHHFSHNLSQWKKKQQVLLFLHCNWFTCSPWKISARRWFILNENIIQNSSLIIFHPIISAKRFFWISEWHSSIFNSERKMRNSDKNENSDQTLKNVIKYSVN